MRYVTRLRLRHAASLQASHIYSIEMVAVKVAYTNPFAFSTAFKREMGINQHLRIPGSPLHRGDPILIQASVPIQAETLA